VAIDVLETLVIHEAVVLRRMRRAAAGGDGLGDDGVDLFPALAAQADDELIGFLCIRDGLVDQRLEEWLGRQHGLDGVADDVHECRVLAAKSVIESKAERGKEGLGLFQVLHWQVEDDLFVHGVSLVRVDWSTGASSLRRTAAPKIDTLSKIFSSKRQERCLPGSRDE
jgi:hypothetical protein